MSTDGEVIIGKLALEKGLISEEQLQEVMDLQLKEAYSGDPESTVGRRQKRPLGVLLVSKGYLTDEQLVALYQERKKRVESLREYRLIERSELLFGQLLVKLGRATQLQINKCLEIQRKMAEQGATPLPRLGEVLTEHGFVDARAIEEVLRMQNKCVMVCAGCESRYNVVGVEMGRRYRCKKCGGILLPTELADSPKVDESTIGDDLVDKTPPPPAE